MDKTQGWILVVEVGIIALIFIIALFRGTRPL
jgi:hypothetical protein